ncbi:MAG: nucleoid-associated protein [Bacteroidia bacterium]|nr:nucleoid-associated protein [Bacteroidia bacterium]
MDFTNASLKQISVHYIGTNSTEQELILSKEPLVIDEELSDRLKPFFLNKFINVYEKYKFTHASSLKFNEVYNYMREIFSEETPFHEASLNIVHHLAQSSNHPKIKSGELYVCYFEGCLIENKTMDAIGVFKTETKNGFFEIDEVKSKFSITYKEGIDVNKFDKGCLVFNTNKKEGFEVLIIDNQNRGEEAQFWKETFLGLVQLNNEFNQTNQFLNITKSFVTKQLSEEFEVTKADQIDLLNRSVQYFKGHENFDKKEFEEEVLQDKGIIKSFRNYDETFRESHEIEVADSFEISPQAVKKQERVFKSVLKLDKNFHIYIHGDKELIEQGVDADGRKYYKIYYKEEN